MLSFPSQNDKKSFFPAEPVYSKKQTWVTANRHIFKFGLIITSKVNLMITTKTIKKITIIIIIKPAMKQTLQA